LCPSFTVCSNDPTNAIHFVILRKRNRYGASGLGLKRFTTHRCLCSLLLLLLLLLPLLQCALLPPLLSCWTKAGS
jgi:hypothetical protein